MPRSRPALAALVAGAVLAAPLAAQTQPPAAAAPPTGADSLAARFTVDKYLDMERVGDPQISPDGTRIVYTRGFVNKLTDRWDSALWLVSADGRTHHFLAKGGSAVWSPDGTRLAYVAPGEPSGPQVFVRYMNADGATSQVTRVSEPVADLRWSPDGKQIAFSTFVPSPSPWKIDMPATPQGASWTPAPKHVTALHYRQDRKGFDREGSTHLFVVAADGGTPRQLTHGPGHVGYRFDGQGGAVAYDWTPDGRTIVVEGMLDSTSDKNYRNSNLYAVDVASCAAAGTRCATRLLTPTPGAWAGPRISPDGRSVAYTGYPATRASYQAAALWVMPLDGGQAQARKISGSLDDDPGTLFWSRDGRNVLFSVAQRGYADVWAASAAGGEPRRLTRGTHMVTLSSASRTGVGAAVRTTPTEPGDVFRLDLASGATTRLTAVNEDLLGRLRLGEVEAFEYSSTNDTKVQGWLVKPPGFDASRKYPLLMEIHGGPHGMYNGVFNPQFQNFAAHGFLVLYTNPRGSTGYGSAFGNAIERAYPGVDYDDLMAGVDAAIGRGAVDTTRMYVGGCSGGGVLSSWVIGHNDRFAAAAVRCPVIDWLSFAGQTDVPYFTYNFFDKPFWEDPKRWLEQSSLMHVGKVTTPTLLMTGELDLRTPMPQSEEYYSALKMRGVPSELLRFEGEYHGTGSRPSNWMRTQLYMMSWYNRWRREGGRPVAVAPSAAPTQRSGVQ
jgi:dipeptidyl aminopeptidase/acylaminoacyl peptidase